ncbi:MAG TPA: hypothetical protein VFZ09_08155 [Archangium sp.]|uniref:hypothetical protein n=1 Tax=Archangium sp. TaxID=1872627 RepID=UPI002E34B9CB|nr:hypothetical protein [Archangium sp.]HEX5746202.1 hypothetical protein [Archangium sp.]
MTKTAWWSAVLLGGMLLALPAAADPEKCETDCASKSSEVIQQCVLKCPEPSNPANTRAYQSCAMRCSERHQKEFDACAKSCDGGGKKKAKR